MDEGIGMKACQKCGSKKVKRELENVYEIDDTTYFDYRLVCEDCLHTKPITVSRKNPVPKARDAATEMAASLKLRQYMPKRKEAPLPKRMIDGLSLKRAFSPFQHSKEIFIYGVAVIAGLAVEIGGLYFERYLRSIEIDPLVGFIMSLLIFIFGPIIVAGSIVYYATRDRLKAILLGSMAVPLTIILLAKLRVDTWGV
ncbi:MAG: hypothetical protein ACE5HY_01395 [Candidatus Hydrothermarchaeales archaeon]